MALWGPSDLRSEAHVAPVPEEGAVCFVCSCISSSVFVPGS